MHEEGPATLVQNFVAFFVVGWSVLFETYLAALIFSEHPGFRGHYMVGPLDDIGKKKGVKLSEIRPCVFFFFFVGSLYIFISDA